MQIGIRQAGRKLSQLINQAVYGNRHITITSRGKPKAILLSVTEYERLTEKSRPPRTEALEEARRLREAFIARYGVLSVDLVQAGREERESRMASLLVSQGRDGEPDEPSR